MFFSICSDRVALARRSNIQDSTNICLEYTQSWSPKIWRSTQILYLRIFHPGQPSSPQKNCKGVSNIFPPGQFQAVQVHIHILILTTCTPGVPFRFFKSALKAIQDLDGRLKILWQLFLKFSKYVLRGIQDVLARASTSWIEDWRLKILRPLVLEIFNPSWGQTGMC